MPPETFGPEEFAAATGVSRETLAKLETYAALLAASPHNLVSEASLKEVWHRHFLDSAQLLPLIPANAKTLVDLGSGAGFPGLVLALLRPDLKVTLFEATRKKAEFLKDVASKLEVRAELRSERIETVKSRRYDVITARAFAPLRELLAYAQKFAGGGSICLFLKGQSHADELTQVASTWKMNLRKHPSQTHPLGVVLEIRDLIHVSK